MQTILIYESEQAILKLQIFILCRISLQRGAKIIAIWWMILFIDIEF